MSSGLPPESGVQPSPQCHQLLSLPIEAVALVLSNLSSDDPRNLVSVELTCRFLRDADVDDAAWRPACRQLWEGKPRWERIRTTEDMGSSTCRLPPPGPSWKHCYRQSLLQSREPLTSTSMQSLRWFLSFKGWGRASVFEAAFTEAGLKLLGYPMLPYKLEDAGGFEIAPRGEGDDEPYAGAGSRAPSADGNDDDQTLLIANFPPHRVSRLPSWEWLIENENVVIWSAAEWEDIRRPQFRHEALRWGDDGTAGDVFVLHGPG